MMANAAWDVVGIHSITMESCPDEHAQMADIQATDGVDYCELSPRYGPYSRVSKLAFVC
jgi:hypothetical protein